jgi:predicted metal-dependent hydrolase
MLKALVQQAFDWLAPEPPAEQPKVRQVVLGGQSIPYQLTRAKRRTIGFIVGNHGLAVRAPKWTTLGDIESAIQEKSNWILQKLFDVNQRQIHSTKAAIEWKDGASIDYLGEPHQISLGALCTAIDSEQKRVWLALPSTASAKQIEDTAQSAIQRAALLLFEVRLNHFAPKLKVHWKSLKLSNAGGRWGSAKSDGTIRLNWRLMHFRLPVIDYVVVHELSHLRHMDHSPRFWGTVESIMPDYAKLKKELKPV